MRRDHMSRPGENAGAQASPWSHEKGELWELPFFRRPAQAGRRAQLKTGAELSAVALLDVGDDFFHRLLSIAKAHERIVLKEQWVLHAGVAYVHRTLEDNDVASLPNL